MFVLFKKLGTLNFGRAPKILYVSALLAPLQKVQFLALLNLERILYDNNP